MSANCIKTTLLASTNNGNLPKLGELIIQAKILSQVNNASIQQGFSITTYSPVVISVDGDGYFATTLAGLDNPSSRMTEYTTQTNTPLQLYFKNDTYNVHISNKYELRALTFNGQSLVNRSLFTMDFSGLKYATQVLIIRCQAVEGEADLSVFSNHLVQKEIALSLSKLSGNLSELPQVNTLDTITLVAPDNKISGTLSELSSFPALKSISIENAAITGSLSELSGIPLNHLVLGNTQVAGDISALSVHASRITRIFLNDTDVDGDIADLGTLAVCTYMRFERTAVEGTIESVASAAASVRNSGTLIVDTTGSGITYGGNIVPNRVIITFAGSGNYTVSVS